MLDLRAARLVALVAAVLVAPTQTLAQAKAIDEQAYRKTTDEAVSEFSAGHWEEARALFKRAHELAPNARTLRGMGMAAFEMRMYVQAIRELDAALKEPRKALDAELRAQVQQLIDKANEFVGRVKLVLDPAEAKPLIDGREPAPEPDGTVLLDVGTHVISATADRYKPTNLRLAVEGGMDQAVRVALEPLLAVQPIVPAIDASHPPPVAAPVAEAPPPRSAATPHEAEPSNLGTYAVIALAGAGAFGIASGVFWLVGNGQYDKLKSSCGHKCSDKQIDDSGVKTSDLLTDVFLGVAAASAITGGVLFAISAGQGGEHESSAQSPARNGFSVSLHAAPSGVALRGKF